MKKKLFGIIPLITLLLIGCSPKGPLKPSDDTGSSVSIKGLSAVLHADDEEEPLNAPLMTLDTSEGEDTGTEEPTTPEEPSEPSEPETPDPNDYIPEGQYIVIYKDETHIDFKIELNNPKKEAITALELECEDKNAKIALQNSKGETEWKLIKDYPVVEWGGTNRYERTFEILLDEGYTEKDCDIKVLDLEVNGEWLAKGLDKNVLDVYKVYDDDLKYEFVYNKEDEYRFKLTAGETVKNLVVSGADPVEGEENVYSVTTEGYISWEYDYEPENGVSAHWRNGKEIEFREIVYNTEILLILDSAVEFKDEAPIDILFGVNFSGTDILFLYLKIDNEVFNFSNILPDGCGRSGYWSRELGTEQKEKIRKRNINNVEIISGNFPIDVTDIILNQSWF